MALQVKDHGGFRSDFFLEAQNGLVSKAQKQAYRKLRGELLELHDEAIHERS
jgi:hypothetical protein